MREEETDMTMANCIAKNNLEGAYERYCTTSANWKRKWWEVVETIFNSSAEWAKKYILDPVKHTLTKLKKRGRPAFDLEALMEFRVEAKGCGAYLVQHFDKDGNLLWTKVGKADDARRRLKQHFTVDYKGQAVRGICLDWFPCKDSDHALAMESKLRQYFRQKGYRIVGQDNDRFRNLAEVTEEDLRELHRMAKALAKVF